MTDIVNKAARSRMMSGIRSKNTAPELLTRKILHGLGFRFRLSSTGLPGRPDVILPKYRVAVFVHGCFWHRHEGCRFAKLPSSNSEFWTTKLQKNVVRDEDVKKALTDSGWRHLTIWECRLRKLTPIDNLPERLSKWIRSDRRKGEFPPRRNG